MASFEQSLVYVLDQEGLFVNNPSDRGGPTNFGISTPTYSKYLGRPASVDDIKTMPMDAVRAIYKNSYWNTIKGEQIVPQSTATFLFDAAVLMGPSAATRLAQTALNLKSDGVIGPITLSKFNAVLPSVFALVFSKACVRAFVAICVANPSQLVFLNQWVRRAHDMTDLPIA